MKISLDKEIERLANKYPWPDSKELFKAELRYLVEQAEKGNVDTKRVTRVEVIDENGRSYVNWNEVNKVETSFQDDERTLKIFITKKQNGMP